MTQKKYPKEIYEYEGNGCEIIGSRLRATLEKAYDCGFTDGRAKERLGALNPLVGWSSLTAAIEANERIDWEKLDGIEAKCIHPELGTLTYKLERDENREIDKPVGWYKLRSPSAWGEIFHHSWKKIGGWSLWVKGEIPLRKLTADELEPGTCFRGKTFVEGGSVELSGVVVQGLDSLKTVIFAGIFEDRLARDVELLEVYGTGTFPTTKEDA